MDMLEQRGFGRLDPSNFGLWLNLDPVVSSPLSPELSSLTLTSFHFPLGNKHREFVGDLEGGDLAFALHCFTMFAHERRHFHDLLATPYGSVLMRQFSRAALLCLTCRNDLLFRADRVAVPISTWVSHDDLFREAYGVQPPTRNICELQQVLNTMQTKLDVFNRGVLDLPQAFKGVDASAILEGMAMLTQQHEVHRTFGSSNLRALFEAFRTPDAQQRYFSALAACSAVLGHVPAEVVNYCLLASLCGNFQDPNTNVPRYPPDLLACLLIWLRKNGSSDDFDNFDQFRERVDDFFDATFGDDVQGMVIQAAKTNEQASAAYAEMVNKIESHQGADRSARTVLAAFENFRVVQAAFAANVMIDPSWYVGALYHENISALPQPVIFIECEAGLPVDASLEELYYIQTESRLSIAHLPPASAQKFSHLADHEGVIRGAHVLSPHPLPIDTQSSDYPLALTFEVPAIDVALWQQVFDEATALLRYLLEGPERMMKPLADTMLLSFAMLGVKVFAVSGELQAPPVPDDAESPAVDPVIRKFLGDENFAKALRKLRASRPH